MAVSVGGGVVLGKTLQETENSANTGNDVVGVVVAVAAMYQRCLLTTWKYPYKITSCPRFTLCATQEE